MSIAKDQRYYLPDGNAIFQVGGIHFKVHASVLSEDDSIFATMFTLKPPDDNVEGYCNESPIILQGDTAESFRALLWALYIPNTEMEQFATNNNFTASSLPAHQDNMEVLVDLAEISYKYLFPSINSWTIDTLIEMCSHSGLYSTSALVRVTKMASLWGKETLHEAVMGRWIQSLDENQGIVAAINVAEELNIQVLRNLAYCAMMKQGRNAWSSDPELSRRQRMKLLSGYYALSRACETIHSNPPRFTHLQFCPSLYYGPTQCEYHGWKDVWSSLFTGNIPENFLERRSRLKSYDLFGKVTLARDCLKQLVAYHDAGNAAALPAMKRGCSKLALEATEKRVKEIFLGPWFQ